MSAPVPFPAGPRQSNDLLGLAWLHGSLQAAVIRKQKVVRSWSAATPVGTIEEFAAALDAALGHLRFEGTEVCLLLENDRFAHQPESAPGFAASAAHAYLAGRVARHETEQGAALAVSQPTLSGKPDRAFILHLLPRSFYDELSKVFHARRLDLTRLLPMIVPIQRELDRFPIAKGRPVLVAVEAGTATIVLVAHVGGALAFARTILASWASDPGRIGLEINRSLLYAKQQYGLAVERIWLLGESNKSTAEITAKCGSGKQITVLPTQPGEWLQSVAKLAPRHPVNLLAGYLQSKRRLGLVRRSLIAACWIGLTALALDSWSRAQAWSAERSRLDALAANGAVLAAERDQLVQRNRAVEHARAFIKQVDGDRLPPVPAKVLAYVSSVLAAEMRLTDFNIKWDGPAGGWSFRLDGAIDSDEETAHELVAALQRHLVKSPLRARFPDTSRAVVSYPITIGAAAPEVQRFSLEGVMLED